MSGLLHRLAARAAGTAPLVRSGARLPFGADALVLEASADLGEPPEAAPVSAQAAAAQMADNPAEATREEAPLAVRQDSQPRPADERDFDAASPATVVAPVNGETPVSGAPAPAAPPQAAAEPPRIAAQPPWLFAPPEAQAPAAPRLSRDGPASRPLPRRVPAPLPLLPPSGVAGAAPALSVTPPAPPPAPPGRRAGPGPEPSEVHVHIGRIEVTAPSEPAPRRIRPEAKPPPRSLDAYLAARGRT